MDTQTILMLVGTAGAVGTAFWEWAFADARRPKLSALITLYRRARTDATATPPRDEPPTAADLPNYSEISGNVFTGLPGEIFAKVLFVCFLAMAVICGT